LEDKEGENVKRKKGERKLKKGERKREERK
jgi:hypothetical protein